MSEIRKVFSTLRIQENTALLVEGKISDFSKGMLLQDENGKTYKVLSVGMTDFRNLEEINRTVSLLIEGKFEGEIVRAL